MKLNFPIKHLPLLCFVGLALFMGSRLSDRFLDAPFLIQSANRLVEIGIIALLITFIISTGEIDLSVGSNTVLTACLVAFLGAKGLPPILTLPACILFGALLGSINGFLVTTLRAPSFLVTVGTLALYRGAAQALLGSKSTPFPIQSPESPTFLFLPIQLWGFLLLAFAVSHFFHRRITGWQLLALGENPEAARYSGLSREKLLWKAFAVCGAGCGVAAYLMGIRFGLVRHEFARGYELDAITMVVIGGTLIRGGSVNLFGTVLAFALVVILRAAMGVANLNAEIQMIAMGILLLLAVMWNQSALISRFVDKRGAKSNS